MYVCIMSCLLCVFMCAHVHACVYVSSLVMTSFDGKIVSYGMSVDGHSDYGMKGDLGQIIIDQLHNVCA